MFNPLGAGPYFRIHSPLTKPYSCIDNLVQICDQLHFKPLVFFFRVRITKNFVHKPYRVESLLSIDITCL